MARGRSITPVRKPCKDVAMRLLARRDHSAPELRLKLLQRGYLPTEVTLTIDELTAAGILDQRRYAEALGREAVERKLLGDAGVVRHLTQHGVEESIAREVMKALAEESPEATRLLALLDSRRKPMSGLDAVVVQRRLTNLLMRYGYPLPASLEQVKAFISE